MKFEKNHPFILVIFAVFCVSFLLSVSVVAEETNTPDEVKIGIVYPLSGAFASFGQGAKKAVQLAVDRVNEQGGVKSLGGAKLNVRFADSEGDPRITKSQAENLIEQRNVDVLMGTILSGTTGAMAPVAERYGVPMVNAGSTSIELTTHGWEYFFRTTPHDGLYCEGILEFITTLAKEEEVGVNTIGLMYENTLFGKTAGDVWKNKAGDFGLEVVSDIAYPAEAADLSSEVTQLKRSNPDVVLLASYAQDAITITKARKTFNFNPKAVVGLNGGHILPAFLEGVGDLGNYVFAEARWGPDIEKPLAQEVNNAFKERTGDNLDGHTARAYTGLKTIYFALEKAGTTDSEELRKVFSNLEVPGEDIIQSWEGIKFDENGQNTLGSPFIVQIIDQEYRTVFPENIATTDPVFPMPNWKER